LQRHQAGRLVEAERLYREVLGQQPGHADATHYLGVLAHQCGRTDAAVELIRRSLVANPLSAVANYNLGNALRDQGEIDEAIGAYRQALAHRPAFPDAYSNLGDLLKSKGELDEAVAAYHRALELDPNHGQAHNNLAIALEAKGQLDEAIAVFGRTVRLRPNHAAAHNNLGNALRKKGQFDKAAAAARLAIDLDPDFPEAYNNLGNALLGSGRLDEALAAYSKALALRPRYAEALVNLATVLKDKGQLDEAIAASRQAILISPNLPEAHYNLGNALRDSGQIDEAIIAYRKAIALRPSCAEAHDNLGNALRDNGRLDEAIAAYRRAICLAPNSERAHSNLGNALRENGQIDEAVDACRKAVGFAPAWTNLGHALKDRGQLDEAIAAYRQAIALAPGDFQAHSNLVYALHFHSDYDTRAIYHEAMRWSQKFAEPLAPLFRPHDNDPDPERSLRIGYVSPDFRSHPLAHNFLPLALSHDREQFHVICYSSVLRPDAMTQQLRALGMEWRELATASDEQLTELIRRDRIDILVDLSMHMANNRLLVFARKPAPVQATCLCSMGTTGLPMIDYRISDAYADPPGFNDAFYMEETVRLPDCYFCHKAPGDSPSVNAVPAARAGHITFGSINNFCKVTPQVLKLWSQILAALPDSRLLVRCPPGSARAHVLDVAAERGVAADRIEFLARHLPADEYLRLHHRLDIYLDPFPYAGHTTSLDALWMGVPLITLAGQTDVGRAGVFLLTNLHMEELIAQTEEGYLQNAVELARDLPRLAAYRATLRERMLKSPLLDTPRFARNIEAAYRTMWRKWCQRA